MAYGCFGNSWMFGGNLFLSWIVNLLIIGILVLLIVWLIKKIQNEDKNTRRIKKK